MDPLEFEEALIEAVKNRSVLYKKKYNYSIAKKEVVWKEIAKSLNKTSKECKNKWKHIRDSYQKNKRRIETGMPAPKSKYASERFYFLDDTYEADPISVKPDPDSGQEIENADWDNSKMSDSEKSDSDDSDYFKSVKAYASEVDTKKKKPTKRKLKSKFDDSFADIKKSKTQPVDYSHAATTSREESSTHKFFNSMADIVASFPENKIAELRMKVCNLVSEMELSVLSQKS